MTQDADARIRRRGDAYEVVFVRHLKHPVEKVWAALTVPERIADWFTEMTFIPSLSVGARIEIGFGREIPLTGQVVALEPPRLFAWRWAHDEHPESVVRCELAPEPGGCVLTFSHSNMRLGKLAEVAGGWHACLDNLDAASAGRAGVPWSPERERAHERRYDGQVAALGPTTVEAPDGVIRKTGDDYEIVFVRRLNKPIEKVWAALTVPERIADWFTEMRFVPDLRLGARVELFFPDDDPVYQMTGEVVAFEPPRLFAWTWPDESHPHSVVRCDLAPDGEGCVLTFSQSGMGTQHLTSVAGGWHVFLEGLEGATECVRTPGSIEREKALQPRYEAQLAALG